MPEKTITEEPLFDVLIPPGVPRKIILEIAQKYDVNVVERKQHYNFANMQGDEREILAFRGKREIVEQVEKFMIQRLKDFIEKE
jgi:hypothetical protein